MEFKATHRFAPLAVRRVRNAAELIRRHPAEEAIEILSFVPNRAASILMRSDPGMIIFRSVEPKSPTNTTVELLQTAPAPATSAWLLKQLVSYPTVP